MTKTLIIGGNEELARKCLGHIDQGKVVLISTVEDSINNEGISMPIFNTYEKEALGCDYKSGRELRRERRQNERKKK